MATNLFKNTIKLSLSLLLWCGLGGIMMNTVKAQWTTLNSGTTFTLRSVTFTDISIGYVVGSSGIILKTTNGGATWTSQISGTNKTLLNVHFTNINIGYAVGTGGIVLKTTDAGMTWVSQNYGTTDLFFSITFTDTDTGYIVGGNGSNGIILKSTNAGATWTALNSGTTYNLNYITFTDANTGYAVGQNGTILKTTNAGATWTALNSGTTQNLLSAIFTDSNTGYITGSGGTILKTTNAGVNWNTFNLGTTITLNSIVSVDANTIYAVGDNYTILKTNNAGTTWTTQTSTTFGIELRSVTFPNFNIGYVVGDNGIILKYTSPSEINLKQNTTNIASEGSYNFGNINVNTSSTDVTFTIENTGSADLTLSGTAGNLVVLGGTDANQFSVTQTNVTSPIAANSNKTFTVKFSPTSTGTKNATLTITSNDADEGTYTINLQGTVTKANQTITFNALPNKEVIEAPFNLTATASSGLPVSYASSNTAVATVSGNTVTIIGIGTTNITASQVGDATYNPATPVVQPFTVIKANQTITFNALPTKTLGDAPFNLTATASSGLPVSYASSNTAVATVSGNTVTIVGIGTTNITASQAGNANYNAAANVVQSLTVNDPSKLNQTITFNALPNKEVIEAPFNLTATASSGLPVSYASSNTAVATVSGNTVTIVGIGTTNITASQAGNATYNPATPVVQPFTVTKANQTITFNALPTKTLGDAPFNLTATASSGLPVSYVSSNTAVATVSGNTVTIVGIGTTNITASQAGNATYNPATPVVQLCTIDATASLEDESTLLYPNPFNENSFTIRWNSARTLVGVLCNSLGMEVGSIKATKNAQNVFQCFVTPLPPGQYYLKIQNEKGEERSFKIVKY